MNGLTINVEVSEGNAMKVVRRLELGLDERQEMNGFIGAQASELTRTHLQNIAVTRHATAQKLGAAPTGFWTDAAEGVTDEATASAASVTIRHPGIGRVDHPVTILPGAGKKYLTIPVNALAYGRRAKEIPGLFFVRTGKGKTAQGILALRGGGKTFTAMYLLVGSVRLPQDRSLLPSDREYVHAANFGIRSYLKFISRN